jgi:hypothetical protein
MPKTRKEAMQEFDPNTPTDKEEGFEPNAEERIAYNRYAKKRMAEHPTGNPGLPDINTFTRIHRK